jgi:hypothetical protein
MLTNNFLEINEKMSIFNIQILQSMYIIKNNNKKENINIKYFK